MTTTQRNISAKNHRQVWKRLFGTTKMRGYVLHHKDTNLIHDDVERYIQWLPQDLELMTKGDHIRLHHTGTHHSDETKQKMREAKLGIPKSQLHRQHMSEAHKRYWIRLRAEQAQQMLTNSIPA